MNTITLIVHGQSNFCLDFYLNECKVDLLLYEAYEIFYYNDISCKILLIVSYKSIVVRIATRKYNKGQ